MECPWQVPVVGESAERSADDPARQAADEQVRPGVVCARRSRSQSGVTSAQKAADSTHRAPGAYAPVDVEKEAAISE